MGIPVGDLFIGSLLPCIGLATLCMQSVLWLLLLKPEVFCLDDALNTEHVWRNVISSVFPPLILTLALYIFAGIATPTEVGALGAIGAMMGSLGSKTFKQNLMPMIQQINDTVIFSLVGSGLFTLKFRGLYGDLWIMELY